MPGAGWSNASSPGFSGAGACWSAGSSILKTFSFSFNSLAYLSSSGNFEIGSSVLSIPKFANEDAANGANFGIGTLAPGELHAATAQPSPTSGAAKAFSSKSGVEMADERCADLIALHH